MTTTSDPLSTTFAALADPTRRAILARLARGDAPVSELAQPFTMSAPAISRHLRVLANAGLIERHVRARWRICRLRGHELRQAHEWLDQYREYWEQSLDRLVDYLEREVAVPDLPPHAPRRRRSAPPVPTLRSTKRRLR
jgi:DNA-binding transcriptional ArsR family regulator